MLQCHEISSPSPRSQGNRGEFAGRSGGSGLGLPNFSRYLPRNDELFFSRVSNQYNDGSRSLITGSWFPELTKVSLPTLYRYLSCVAPLNGLHTSSLCILGLSFLRARASFVAFGQYCTTHEQLEPTKDWNLICTLPYLSSRFGLLILIYRCTMFAVEV